MSVSHRNVFWKTGTLLCSSNSAYLGNCSWGYRICEEHHLYLSTFASTGMDAGLPKARVVCNPPKSAIGGMLSKPLPRTMNTSNTGLHVSLWESITGLSSSWLGPVTCSSIFKDTNMCRNHYNLIFFALSLQATIKLPSPVGMINVSCWWPAVYHVSVFSDGWKLTWNYVCENLGL